MGFEESDGLIRTAAALLDSYRGQMMPNDAKKVIALFAGQAAVENEWIIHRGCGEF